ncbi:MAG: MFS transporter, partial [Elusimicrobiota bacterium]|nr:MFS transporter [Elusimicrobiota bacterium]
AGAAVGIVDGMVYLGTGLQSVIIGNLAPVGAAAKDPGNWFWWPVFLVPFALIGLFLSARIWNAVPKRKPAAVSPAPATDGPSASHPAEPAAA